MRRLPAVLLSLMLALAPGLAMARAGSGFSMGSRGSRTFSAPPTTSTSPFAAQPMQRSFSAPSPSYASPGFAAPNPGFGMSRRSAFSSGLMGGLIGAGLGGLLFGGGLFGGMHGGGSFLGLLIQLALLFFVGRWLYRRFFAGQLGGMGGGRPLFAGLGAAAPANANRFAASGSGGYAGASPRANPSITVSRQDFEAFSQLLTEMQAAWSNADLARLQRIATPEMVSYFGEQLAEQASRGVRNTVSDVHLEKGDLSEAWSEGQREYATVAMRFSSIDVTRDRSGRVVDGSEGERITATELWTFLRARGGQWVLSAIQQGG